MANTATDEAMSELLAALVALTISAWGHHIPECHIAALLYCGCQDFSHMVWKVRVARTVSALGSAFCNFLFRSLHGPRSGGFYACTLRDPATQQSTLRSIVNSMSVTVRSTLRSLYRRERDYLQRYFAQAEDATDLATVVRHMRRLVATALAGDGDTVVGTNGKTRPAREHRLAVTASVQNTGVHDSSAKGSTGTVERIGGREAQQHKEQVADVECSGTPQHADISTNQQVVVTSDNEAGATVGKPPADKLKKCTKKEIRRLHPRANMRNILKVC